MNIFVTSNSPVRSAKMLDNKRVVKMILESAQLLSTALHRHKETAQEPWKNVNIPYKPTHVGHPCTIWAMQTRKNYWWLFRHFIALCREYEYRYGKEHKCYQYIGDFYVGARIIPDGPLTKFANCTANQTKGISFKHINEPVEAYKAYLAARWDTDTLIPKWTNRTKPEWYRGIYA